MHKRTSWARLARWIAVAAAIGALVVPSAQARPLIDGGRTGSAEPEFVPGVTDFPSRLGAKAEQAARRRVAVAQETEWPLVTVAARDFDWAAAGIGALICAGALSGAAIALRTRPRLRFGRAH